MSMEGAGQCGICGAWSDYCTLETAAGPSVDCRDLMLKPEIAPMYESDSVIKAEKRIVEWLRNGQGVAQMTRPFLADAIERGDHRG